MLSLFFLEIVRRFYFDLYDVRRLSAKQSLNFIFFMYVLRRSPFSVNFSKKKNRNESIFFFFKNCFLFPEKSHRFSLRCSTFFSTFFSHTLKYSRDIFFCIMRKIFICVFRVNFSLFFFLNPFFNRYICLLRIF